MMEQIVNFDRMEHALVLIGNYDENIRLVEQHFDVSIVCRGTEIKVAGPVEKVPLAVRTVEGLLQY
ncbi:MAG: phosphate starvation-inducible protein PhoH, partial [Oscillospiraceae bacterium]|nr:phosphate starvation-inducible protein PhoH [Oscillospiraceae bacterium]